MGRAVAQTVAARLGRSLLELGGNNGMIVAPSADLDLALRSIVFAAAGTCGQRCTTLRRVFVHNSIADRLRDQLLAAYERLPIGDPTADGILVGPLIDGHAFENMQAALAGARQQGATIYGGERLTSGVPAGGFYVRPALVEINADCADRPARDIRADVVLHAIRSLRAGHSAAQRCPAGPGLGRSDGRCPRGGMVLLGRGLRLRHREREYRHQLAPKLAARLAARRKRAAAANRVPIPGSNTCAALPAPSTIPTNCPWRKGFVLRTDLHSNHSSWTANRFMQQDVPLIPSRSKASNGN